MEKKNFKNQAMGNPNSCPPVYNPKKNEKDNTATVVGAAAGIGGGVAVGVGAAALWPNSAEASETDDVDFINKAEAPEADNYEHAQVVEHVTVHHAAADHHVDPAAVKHPVEPVEPVVTNEAQVVNYTQLVDESGNHIADVAQVRYGSEDIHYFDTDMNNEADVAWYDANRNAHIDEGEIVDVADAHIRMSDLHQVAQSSNVHVMSNEDMTAGMEIQDPGMDYTAEAGSDIAMTDDMPDYVNDADIDSFVG